MEVILGTCLKPLEAMLKFRWSPDVPRVLQFSTHTYTHTHAHTHTFSFNIFVHPKFHKIHIEILSLLWKSGGEVLNGAMCKAECWHIVGQGPVEEGHYVHNELVERGLESSLLSATIPIFAASLSPTPHPGNIPSGFLASAQEMDL